MFLLQIPFKRVNNVFDVYFFGGLQKSYFCT